MPLNPILNKVHKIFEKERGGSQLDSLPPTLYREVADYIKKTRNGSEKEGQSTRELIASEERKLLARITTRLLQLRVRKIIRGLKEEGESPALTPEEKYIIEPLITSAKRALRLERAIVDGRTSFLETIMEKATSKYSTVRFLSDAPSTVGVDLVNYGPFLAEDVALLPMENVRPLVIQGIVQELDIEI
ncbi:MAG: hypothetical protein V3T99_04305 [Nitrososphaerales archaeon]